MALASNDALLDSPDYVRAYWHKAAAGKATVDLYERGTLVSAFIVTASDVADYPALTGVYALAVWEDAAGEVHHACLDKEHFNAFVARGNAGSGEE